MKAAVLLLSLFAVPPDALGDDAKSPASRLPAGSEVVMSPGMRITATMSVGTIAITAVDGLTRSYTWDGETRAAEMTPRNDYRKGVRQPRHFQRYRGRILARPPRDHARHHGRGPAAVQDSR